MTGQPYTFDQARQASRDAADNQRAAEKFLIDSTRAYAEAERAYRKATTCADVARGDKTVADLRYKRDIAEGVKEAAAQSARRASGDRKAQQTFIEWSMRRDLAEGYHPPQGEGQTFGGRRAA